MPSTARSGHLQCPFCGAYTVQRLYVAPLNLDSCSCDACAAQWDEERGSGRLKGRGSSSSVLIRRE